MPNQTYKILSCFFCSLLAIAVLFPRPVLAAPDLDHFVAKGKIPPGLAKQMDDYGVVEALVTVYNDDINQEASRKRRENNLKENDRNIRAYQSAQYGKRKQAILAEIAQDDVTVLTEYSHLPVMHVEVARGGLMKLLNSNLVDMVHENQVAYPHLLQSVPLIGADSLHSMGHTGTGAAVAVLDTGVDYTRDAFGNCTAPGVPASCKVVHAQDFAPNDFTLDADSSKHGTNVTGIVAGVAPGAKLIGLDVFDGGLAYYNHIIQAINWVRSNKETYNIVAVNISIGGGTYSAECPSDGLASSISLLKSDGITTSISAGNSAYKTALSAPACVPDALSVGAVYDANIGSKNFGFCQDFSTLADQVICFSNSAYFLKLLAPGGQIEAADVAMYGTSQAAPHAAGTVALLKEVSPSMTVDEIISQLRNTGVPVTDTRVGAGNRIVPRLDIFEALTELAYAPVADFTATPASGGIPLIADFTDQSANIPVTWSWDFDDGNASTLQHPTHIYTATGSYSVSLTVNNQYGTDIATQPGLISATSCGSLAARTGGTGFSSLQNAYNAALDGGIVQSHIRTFTENLVLNRPITVTLSGGYNCEYNKTAPSTTIQGYLTINEGTVTIENMVIQ